MTVPTPQDQTPEARAAWLMSLSPAERLAEIRRVEREGEQPGAASQWSPAPPRALTTAEHERLGKLPLVERVAEFRRLGLA